MSIEKVIAAAGELRKLRLEIENLTNEKNEFNLKIDAINVKLTALRIERDRMIAEIKRDAAGL